MKINVPLIEATAAKVKLIKRDKPETTIVKDGVNTRVSASTSNKALLQNLKVRLKVAEGEVKQIRAEIADLEAAKQKKADTNVKPAVKGKHTFLVTEGFRGGLKVKQEPKQRTVKTLKAAINVKGAMPPARGYSVIYAVTESGSKSAIMRFTSVDPITGRKFKGYSWHFVSARAKARFGDHIAN